MSVKWEFIFYFVTMDVRFKTPANFFVCGQTQCGKSYMVRRMLNHLEEMFHPLPTKTIYCYGEYQNTAKF